MTEAAESGDEAELDLPRLGETYSRTAAFYDEVAQPFQEAAKLTAIGVLDRQPGERFLEVGFGTGWVFERIVGASGVAAAGGVELAAGMIDVAARRLRQEREIDGAPFLLADASRLPFSAAAFDCLLSSYTLEVLPTRARPAVLRELGRVLRPGGRIVLVNLTEGEGADRAISDDWWRRYERDPAAFGGARPVTLAPALAAVTV